MYGRNIEIHVDIFHVYCFAIFQVYHFSLREQLLLFQANMKGDNVENRTLKKPIFE